METIMTFWTTEVNTREKDSLSLGSVSPMNKLNPFVCHINIVEVKHADQVDVNRGSCMSNVQK